MQGGNMDFVDPCGTCFLHLVRNKRLEILPEKHYWRRGHSQSGPNRYSLEETPGTVEYGQYGYMRSGCNIESNRSHRGIR